MPPAERLREWAAVAVTVFADGPDVVDVGDVALRGPLTVRGRVVARGGGAAPTGDRGIPTRVWMASAGSGMLSPPAAVPVDAEGRFELRGAVEGRYHLLWSLTGGWAAVKLFADGRDVTFDALELTNADLDVTLELTNRILGGITPFGVKR